MQENPIYKFLKSNNLTTKDENSFLKEYSDPAKVKQLHGFLKSNNLTTKDEVSFYDTYFKKKNLGESVSLGTTSQLPSQPDFLKQGASLADNSFLKEVSKSVPKGTGKPNAPEGKWSNIVQNVFANLEKTGTEIASGVSTIGKDMYQAANPYAPNIPSTKTEAEKATPTPWELDPFGNVIRGLHGNTKRMEGVIANNPLPNTFWGRAVLSAASFVPDIVATAALPEAKLIQGAGWLAKTGNLLFNNFTRYMTAKEGVIDYSKARDEGKSIGQASLEGVKGAGKGMATGMEMALLGAGSNLATKSVMNQAERLGLRGAGGMAIKELVNLNTDVLAFGIVSPLAHAGLEGRWATGEEMANGTGIAALFRIKGGLENVKSNTELNRALRQTQELKQGVAISNFVDATPESIVEVYNSPESADELHLKALLATKKAKETTDLQKKAQYTAEAVTLAKASGVKQATDMIIDNKDNFAAIKESDLPQSAKDEFLQKATEINKLLNPFEKSKTDLDNKIKESEDLFTQFTQKAAQSQDPIERARFEAQAKEAVENGERFRNELSEVKSFQSKPDANVDKGIPSELIVDAGSIVPEEIDSKKSDIERRRAEELSKLFNKGILFTDESGKIIRTLAGDEVDAKYDAELNSLKEVKPEVKVTEEVNPTEVKPVEQLRKEEQAELDSKIPNAEQYRADGKVDRSKLTNQEDVKAFDEVYKKYDELITPLLEKPIEQKVTVDLLSSQEPPQKEGETIVTLSGKTETERAESIDRRSRETKVSDKVVAENGLIQDAENYFKKDGRYKNSSEGRNELNNLRIKAREVGLEIDTDRDSVTRRNKAGRPTKVSYNNKADGEAVIDPKGKIITERSREVQDAFEELTDAGVFLDVQTELGKRMSASQIDAAVKDILDGVPSKRAEKYLNALEKAIAEDAFPLYDKAFGDIAPKLSEIRDQLGVEREIVGEPMDEVALNKFLDEESKLTPEEEQDLLDNVENLLYEYETTEEGPQGEVQPIEARAEEGVSGKAEPVTEAKATGEAPKSVKEVYDEFSSKKSEMIKKKIINDNFDTIVEDLIKNKKIERIC